MKKNNKDKKENIRMKNAIIFGSAIIVIAVLTLFSTKKDGANTGGVKSSEVAKTVAGGDLTITKADITDVAKYYGYQSNDTYMEVLAVRASDGTIRTALNTCQICNNSGRGYYVQEGDVLVCQNCGNQFTIDQIEKVKNGCNPVPLDQSIKTEDDEKVVIMGDAISQYEPLFRVWKK